VIDALEKRGRNDEADYWYCIVAIELEMFHGIPEEDILDMKIDDILFLMKAPPKPVGTDLFAYGRANIAS